MGALPVGCTFIHFIFCELAPVPTHSHRPPALLLTAPARPQVGVEIIQRAIRRPAKTIAANAGLEGDVIVGKLLEMDPKDENIGFNAAIGRFEDLVKAGVIDPMKVR